MKSINIVLAKPHHGLIVDSRVCKYQSLKNTSTDTIKWLEKRPTNFVDTRIANYKGRKPIFR
ncbi:MAG: DUF2357 domain-containing protein [Clostridium sp.]|uniref:DUF2357 domain-containing protein n=1 Tax=Clostridium sp. TaxID=1506 RepID=UPI003D6D266B